MIHHFSRITICNLFSYRDRVDIDLGEPDQGRSIVLIYGRNGFGKTNFLRSLKLLFQGAEDSSLHREVRTDGKAGHISSAYDYVNGIDGIWHGILNRAALARPTSRYFVEAEWRDSAGIVLARRSWSRRAPWSGKLKVWLNDDPVADPAEFIARRLPSDVIPFYFFDGERIRDMAFSMGQGDVSRLHVEAIFGLNHIRWAADRLRTIFKSSVHKARQRSTSEQEKSLQTASARLDGLAQVERDALDSYDTKIKELETRVEAIRERLTVARAQNAIVKRIQGDWDSLVESRSEARANIVEWCKLSPYIVAKDKLAHYLENPTLIVDPDVRPQFYRLLPRAFDNLRASGIRLAPEFVSALTEAYERELDHLLAQAAPSSSRLRPRKDDYLKLEVPEAALQHLVNIERKLWGKVIELRQNVTSQDDMGLRRQLGQLIEQIAILRDEKSRAATKLGELDKELRATHEKLDEVQQKLKAAGKLVTKGNMARAAAEALETYIGLRLERVRPELERAMESRYRQLDETSPVSKIQMKGQGLSIHCLDRAGQRQSQASLSSGQRQLLATALIWALNEVSGVQAPIVIDTPLGRIDRKHQENVLKRYYPHASSQTIVLPTDSELSEEKLVLLAPHVYRVLQLRNVHGSGTEVLTSSLAELGAE